MSRVTTLGPNPVRERGFGVTNGILNVPRSACTLRDLTHVVQTSLKDACRHGSPDVPHHHLPSLSEQAILLAPLKGKTGALTLTGPRNCSTDTNMYKPERLSAFCDGVIAIAITLLVLGLEVPSVHSMTDKQLSHYLLESWHAIWGYVVSFVLIGTYWLQHYVIFHHITRVDRTFVALNGLFLLTISFVPFPTGLQSSFRHDNLAMIVYAFSQAACGLSLLWLWRYAAKGHRLIDPKIPQPIITGLALRSAITPIVSLLAIAVLPLSNDLCRLMFLLIPLAQFARPSVDESWLEATRHETP